MKKINGIHLVYFFLSQVTWAPCDCSVVSYKPLAKLSLLDSSWKLVSLPLRSLSGFLQVSLQLAPLCTILSSPRPLTSRALCHPAPPPPGRHVPSALFCQPPLCPLSATIIPANTSLSPPTLSLLSAWQIPT